MHSLLYYTMLQAIKRATGCVIYSRKIHIYIYMYIWVEGAGYSSRTTQHMRQSVMDIIILPGSDFFPHGVGYLFIDF
jgi:hypothetical protein